MSALALDAARSAIHNGKGCTCRRGARGDAEDAVSAFLMALPADPEIVDRVAAIVATKFDEDAFDVARLILEALAVPTKERSQ